MAKKKTWGVFDIAAQGTLFKQCMYTAGTGGYKVQGTRYSKYPLVQGTEYPEQCEWKLESSPTPLSFSLSASPDQVTAHHRLLSLFKKVAFFCPKN